ncbi:MAG: citrate:proton symporter [Sporomusaceae bacterium]|nr:citrate:proton symporter [Sporomusaceae bacterium]
MTLLAVVGFIMVAVFMILIMTKRLHPVTALILVPFAVAMAFGWGPQSGKWIVDGVKKVVPTSVMLCFAILYFGILIDVGFFDPLVNRIVRFVKGDPVKLCVGTAILAAVVALDGDGATTYMVTCTALYPLHKRMQIKPLILPALCLMQVSIMNILPWGGPSGRVLIITETTVSQLFGALGPSMFVALIWVCLVAYYWGLQERKRLGIMDVAGVDFSAHAGEEKRFSRPQYVQWINLAMTLGLIVMLMKETIPLPAMFMLAAALALIVNYPKIKDQSRIMAEIAPDCLNIVILTFAAGAFVGIMQGSKMIDQMAKAMVVAIPESMGAHLAFISSFLSMPGVYFLTNDAYYYGVLPIFLQAAKVYDVTPVAMGIGALIGQGVHLLSPLVASTYLLVGLTKVDYGDLQRFTLLPCISISMVMLIVAMLLGHIKF